MESSGVRAVAPTRDRWAASSLALVLALVALVVIEIQWHPGYALGDEADVISALQRMREGMPAAWVLGYGCLHKWLALGSLSLWPGRLWAGSVPGVVGFALEGWLLFLIGRRLGGSRAGFFAVLAGLFAAFSLIRARVALSFSLFALEWLLLFWLRPLARRPWAALLWGALLGLFCFDYEAWLPMALLLLLLPLQEGLSREQRGWELVGLAAVLVALVPWHEWAAYLDRRHQASVLRAASPQSWWQGLWQLVWAAPCEPYMAPAGHGVLPLWQLVALPLGFKAWGRNAWRPFIYVAAGIALVLAGGAPYGLPAHRLIMAWPLLALLTGLGLDHAMKRWGSLPQRVGIIVLLSAAVGHQAGVWVEAAQAMDIPSRSPIRDLHQAARAAWERSRDTGWPIVSELHPLKGPQFRFLSGQPLPVPEAQATTVVAYLPWDYLPAVKGQRIEVARFKTAGGSAPEFLGVLTGQAAQDALGTERAQRPLLSKRPFIFLPSGALEAAWLRENPQASPWARTFALDYEGMVLQHNHRVSVEWIRALDREALVSVRPLIVGILALKESDPPAALALARRARNLDPFDARIRRLERGLLLRLGRQDEALRLDQEVQTLYEQGRLLSEQ